MFSESIEINSYTPSVYVWFVKFKDLFTSDYGGYLTTLFYFLFTFYCFHHLFVYLGRGEMSSVSKFICKQLLYVMNTWNNKRLNTVSYEISNKKLFLEGDAPLQQHIQVYWRAVLICMFVVMYKSTKIHYFIVTLFNIGSVLYELWLYQNCYCSL